MKKIWCLLLAAAMVTGAAQASHAVDFKAKGVWLASFQYGQNGNFTNGGHTGYDPSEDEFEARSRVRLVIDAVADRSTLKSASPSGARPRILRAAWPWAPTRIS